MGATVIMILASAGCVVGFSALLAIALGRAAARGDRDLEMRRAERRTGPRVTVVRQHYAGWARGPSPLARGSSMTLRSSRTSLRAQRP